MCFTCLTTFKFYSGNRKINKSLYKETGEVNVSNIPYLKEYIQILQFQHNQYFNIMNKLFCILFFHTVF